jgi:tetratricopeptide (TPR) repeat protein
MEKLVADGLTLTGRHIKKLESAIINHRCQEVIRVLKPWIDNKCNLRDLSISEAARWLRCASHWIAYDPSIFTKVSHELTTLQNQVKNKGDIPVIAAANMALSEGLIDYYNGNYDLALEALTKAQICTSFINDPVLQLFTYYHMGKCLWRLTKYKESLHFIEKAIECREETANPLSIIDPLIQKAWLHFLLKDYESFREATAEAKSRLDKTDDCYNKANLASAEGRMAQQMGDYDDAITYFNESIKEYNCDEMNHPNRGRSYANIAFVFLLKGLELEEPSKKRVEGQDNTPMLNQALVCLNNAEDIYSKSAARYGKPESRGIGRVKYIRSFAHHYLGNSRVALKEAEDAYNMGKENNDYIIMANAKIAETMVKVESGNTYGALESATDALNYADNTQNKLIQAHAYLFFGKVMITRECYNFKKADECQRKVNLLLETTAARYYLWKEFREFEEEFKKNLHENHRVVEIFPNDLERKQFNEIIEEVSGKIIRYHYDRCHNIEEVRKKLGIGATKVRKYVI